MIKSAKGLLPALIPLLFLTLCFPANATEKVNKFVYSNGLTVLTSEDHTVPLVSVAIIYHVGTKNEMPGLTGLTQICKYIINYGTRMFDRDAFGRVIQAGGGAYDSRVGLDLTTFQIKAPSNLLDSILILEADRMQNVIPTIEKLLLAKNDVRKDRLVNVESSIYGNINEEFLNLAFRSHPYRNPMYGWPGDINEITLDDVKDYFDTYFQPANATIVIVGDGDTESLKIKCKELFGEIVSYPKPAPRQIIEPSQVGERISNIQGFAGIPAFIIGFHTPEATSGEFPIIGLINNILIGGESSRLKHRMVSEEKSALYVGGGIFRTEDPSILYNYAILNYDTPIEEGERQMCQEFDRLKSELVSEAELERAKNKIEADYYRAVRDMNNKASVIGFHEIIAHDHDYSIKYVKRARMITPEEVFEAANKYLNVSNRTAVFLHSGDKPGEENEENIEQ